MKANLKNFILEVGTEEIPARLVADILASLKDLAAKELKINSLSFEKLAVFGTCRRLVLSVTGLAAKQPDESLEIKGPPKQVAFDTHGNPMPAALGFIKAQNIDLKDLITKTLDGREYLFAKIKRVGQKTEKILPEILLKILNNLYLPISMRWGQGEYKFIRPVHWLLALYGGGLIDFEWAGQKSAAKTAGHRYIKPGFIKVISAEKYFSVLKKAGVIWNPEERKKIIVGKLKEFSAKVPEELLEETVYLVENPVFVLGKYHERFLTLPEQILELAMEKYQKYFPIPDRNSFVVVADGLAPGELAETKIKNIRSGNEQVLTARLTDAQFFYEHDLKIPLGDWLKKLKGLTLYKNLGTVFDKVERIGKITGWLFQTSGLLGTETEAVARQTLGLLKNDLLTLLVGEIDVLQGIAGALYAKAQGYPEAVARAIEEHYHPRFTGDTLPLTPSGEILAVADKIDTLVTFFAAGHKPTGSSDPFALRRAAQGIIFILLNKNSSIKFRNLKDLIRVAFEALKKQATEPEKNIKLSEKVDQTRLFKDLEDFIFQRLRQILGEEKFRYDLIETVLASGLGVNLTVLKNVREILRVLTAAAAEDWFKSFVATAVRVKRLGEAGKTDEVTENLLTEPAEKELFQICQKIMPVYDRHLTMASWPEAIFELRQLIKPVDKFFVDVLVMDKDQAVRNNRLALLRFIDSFFEIIGNFEKVVL